jgi:hypothetical protein
VDSALQSTVDSEVQCRAMAPVPSAGVHLDLDNLLVRTESDVEQKILMPLLIGGAYLSVPASSVHTKEYLEPTQLDKDGGKKRGYFPDYSIWASGFLVMVVEAKAPQVPVEEGYREASLYARHVNQGYPTGLNPCRFILASNGEALQFGFWDAQPELTISVCDLRPGSAILERLCGASAFRALDDHAQACLRQVRTKTAQFPFEIAGGQSLLNAKLPVNTFASDLSPILRRYFTSNQEDVHEIARKAYVNSAEVTSYDRVLESLLKERLSVQRDTLVQELQPDRKGEGLVARSISDFDKERPIGGQLQIIQGAVGSGKSLFVNRYHDVLQPQEAAARTRWAFVDFNFAPPNLSSAYGWLCEKFAEDFQERNPQLDLSSLQTLRGIFSRNIQKNKGVYEALRKASPEREEIARAEDLRRWHDDPRELARGIADYVLGSRREVLAVVLDNVDRLDLNEQLSTFQLALSFMAETKSFVILQMRDETYERSKNRPPLDTFRSGITFHISPPRFVDVVKRRLELSLEYLSARARDVQSYTLQTGLRITYPKSAVGIFLHELYIELFERTHNIPRILESLAGSDARKALEMFVSIITSGHLSETAITSRVIGGQHTIREYIVLKILMRTDYRFASDQSGVITNIFRFDPDWQKPDNFLLIEILYFLVINRKRVGQIGLEGYWTCRHIAEEMQRFGYIPEDTLLAANYLLHRQLVSADHLNFRAVEFNDSVKISASGFMHLRILPARLEYLFGVLPTTPFADHDTARLIADFVKRESTRGRLAASEKARAVEIFYAHLYGQFGFLRDKQPFAPSWNGASLVLRQMNSSLEGYRNRSDEPEPGSELDIV